MKRQWTVARRAVPRPDAPRRWDRAYQLLLRLADGVPDAAAPAPSPAEKNRHAGSRLRPRLDATSGAEPER